MSTKFQLPVKQFDEKIDSIKTQFFSALDDFKKYYVYYNKNPEVNEFQNYYANSKSQLQSMSKDLFVTTNDIDKQIEILEETIQKMDKLLKQEKTLHGELLSLLKNIHNTHVGSEILIDDSKAMYNQQYYYNWELIVGIFITSGLLATIFTPRSQNN
jgi:hypothetical protein